MARNVLNIRNEDELRFDDNEEDWPNAELAMRSSYEDALIDGFPDKVRAGDEREIAQKKDLQLNSWVKEAEVPPRKSILLTSWAQRNEVRSRCVLKDFAATVRDDVFTPTPSPVSVRGLLLYAAWYDIRVETGDLVCAFMQADTSCEMFDRPLKGQELEGWIWRLHGAMNGMRTESRDFTEFPPGVLTLTEYTGFYKENWSAISLSTSRTRHELCLMSTTRSPVQNLRPWTNYGYTLRSWWFSREARQSILANLRCTWVFRAVLKNPDAEDLL